MATRIDLTNAMIDLSPTTKKHYGRWTQRFLGHVYLVDPTRFNLAAIRVEILLTALRPEHLRTWLNHLRDSNLRRATVTQARTAIIWLAQYLADTERTGLETPGALSYVRTPDCKPDRPRTWLDESQTQALLDALGTEDRPAMRARNTAIIVLMITCGLRRAEVATAQWGDLRKAKGKHTLMVRGKGLKTRTITLPTITTQALNTWRKFHPCPYGENPIFTRITSNGRVTSLGLTGQAIRDIVDQVGQVAGLDISPHDLRRAFALGAFQAGADYEAIRVTLGHVSAGTTQRYIGKATRPTPLTPETKSE